MNNNFSLPGLKLETVNLISKVNNVIRIYTDNSPQNQTDLTEETIKDIMSQYDGNAYKFLELWRILILYAVRKGKPVHEVLISEFEEVFNTLRPEEYNMAISVINRTRSDIDTVIGKRIPMVSYLSGEFTRLIDTLRKKSLDKDTSSQDLEVMFNLDMKSDMHFSAVLDSLLETTQELMDNCNLHESTLAATARKVKDKVTSKVVKYSIKDKEVSEKLNEKFNRFLDEYKENKKVASYDKFVKNTFNLSKLLKNLLLGALVFVFVQSTAAVSLVAAIIAMLVKFSLDKRTEDKHKKVILADLKFEKTMLQEKIKDAEAKGDKKAKYQLMRIENEVSRAIDRIMFGLSQK